MSKLTLRVEGMQRTLSHFDLMAHGVSQVIDETSKEGAKKVQIRAKELAPKKTGKLRKSIKNRKGKYGITHIVRPRSNIAHLQEYGTKKGIKSKRFMQKAREQIVPGVQRDILRKVEQAVRR